MARKHIHIDRKLVKKHLHYDPLTGLFSRRIDSGLAKFPKGFVYRPRTWNVYQRINVAGVSYAAHRLAWVYMTGKQPNIIDHDNGVRHDNRFANLKNGTYADNAGNHAKFRKANGTFIEEPN